MSSEGRFIIKRRRGGGGERNQRGFKVGRPAGDGLDLLGPVSRVVGTG